ncbi:hypothetical protein D3C78_891160 [compost metagenome]
MGVALGGGQLLVAELGSGRAARGDQLDALAGQGFQLVQGAAHLALLALLVGLLDHRFGHVVTGVAVDQGLAEQLALQGAHPEARGVAHVVGDAHFFAVLLAQAGEEVAMAGPGDLAAQGLAHHLRAEQVGDQLRRGQHRFPAGGARRFPGLVRAHVAQGAGLRVADLAQAAVRAVVVGLDLVLDPRHELGKGRNQPGAAGFAQLLAAQAVDLGAGVLVHVGADVAGQLLGGVDPDGLVRSLDQAARLAVVGQGVGHGAAQAVDHFAHGVVGEAGAVVDIEDGEHAAALDCVAQGVHHADGGLGLADADAQGATGADIEHHGGFRAVRLAGARVEHLGVELVAVGGEHVARQQVVGAAALERLQGFQFLRGAAAGLAGLRAQLVQEAAHLVDARALALAAAGELGIAGLDAGLGRALEAAQEVGRPGRHAHVLLPARRCQPGFAVLAVVGQPALEGALGEAAVVGLAVVGAADALVQVGAEVAGSGQTDQRFDGALLGGHLAHTLDFSDEGQAGGHHRALVIAQA